LRFRAAAKSLGVSLRLADPWEAMLELSGDEMWVRIGGRKIPPPASVLPRLGPGNYANGLALLDHFETQGIPVCNSREAISTARDTIRTLFYLHKAGLRVPRTVRLISMRDLKVGQKIIPGPPWIMKTFTGAMGIGTMLVREVDQLEALAATLWALKQPVLLQEFVRGVEDGISDIRALVVGGKVLGAIRRIAPPGEYRTNVHQGGVPQQVKLSKADEKIALQAAKAVGLNIAGVDWIVTKEGPVVLEVNATPGFRGFESATGIDAALAMLSFAAHIGKIKV